MNYASVGSHSVVSHSFSTLWTVASHAPLSMGLSWHEYYSGLPFPPPGDLPNPGIEPMSLMIPALAGRFFTTTATWEAWVNCMVCEFYLSKAVTKKCLRASLMAQLVKNLPANAGDPRHVGLIPRLGRSPEFGDGNLLQYSCLENSEDLGTRRAIVHEVIKRWI